MNGMFHRLSEDIRTALATDPAARGIAKVLTYPGLYAFWAHRVAHWLWNWGFRLTARVLFQLTRLLMGVEIHPGAAIDRRCFTDHCMGVVIGDNVHLYHGWTLGGDSLKRGKRHLTVEDGETIGATVGLLEDITIGTGATVGAGAIVVESVPQETTVGGVPAESLHPAETERPIPC